MRIRKIHSLSAWGVAWLVMSATVLLALFLRGAPRQDKPDLSPAMSEMPAGPAAPIVTAAEQRESAIHRALGETISVDVNDVPLDEAVRDLAQRAAVPIEFDREAISDDGISLGKLVTLKVPRITPRSALRLLLDPDQLTFVVANEVLLITPTSRAADLLEVRVYDVTDLVLVADSKAPGRADFISLMNMISCSVQPDSWEDLSGPGSMSRLSLGTRRVLSIRQTQRAHAEVDRLLTDLRYGRKVRGSPGPHPIVVTSDRTAAALREEAIRKALDRNVTVEAEHQPLDEVLTKIAAQAGVPFVIDRTRLIEDGVDIRKRVSMHYAQISGRSALALLLKPVQLAWIVQHEVLQITTMAHAADAITHQIYDISDIAGKFRAQNGKVNFDVTSLSNAVTTLVQPDGWEEGNHYPGVFRFHDGVFLVYRQTQSTHEEIAAFLFELRKVRLADPAGSQPQIFESTYGGMARSPWRAADPARDALVRGNNQFALELYSKLARDTSGNLLVSPYCISGAVALAYAGARGHTAAEIAATMHYVVRQEDVPAAFRSLQPGMFLWGPDARLQLTRQFWGRQGIEYQAAFQKVLGDYYQSAILPLDFADPGAAAQAINGWTVARTGGSILRLANPGDFTPTTGFAVASAVHFDGKWSSPFDPAATRLTGFASPNGQVDVALMHLPADRCRYAVVDGVQILEKTYGKQDVSMVVLLAPESPSGLTVLEAALNENSLARWLAAQDSQEAEIFLPRFKLESAFNLRRELEELGMRSAFDSEAADFSGISESQRLALSGVVHKVFAQFDEQGPRLAPGMGEHRAPGPNANPQVPVFRANRPFLFLIRDTQSGSIVLIGRVVRPEAVDRPAIPTD
ncbi:MAG: serpin family protein [Planctomycetia bacterium]|nr:serpin family protein [Planctomycetia bacterium]